MVAFEVHGDPHAVIGGVRLITPAVSLGSVDTLIQHPASISHRIVDAEDRRGAGVNDRLLRMSVGLEDVEDLWTDLDAALGERRPVSHAGLDRRAPRAGTVTATGPVPVSRPDVG
jgi:methionine-gamma-lyase